MTPCYCSRNFFHGTKAGLKKRIVHNNSRDFSLLVAAKN
jgi:hypothetical protein